MKTKPILWALLLMLGVAGRAFGEMGEVKEPGFALPETFPAAARNGIMAALRRPDCRFVDGTFFNQNTYLRYAGETRALNLMLEDLARTPGCTLSIRFQDNATRSDYDWLVEHDGWDPTGV